MGISYLQSPDGKLKGSSTYYDLIVDVDLKELITGDNQLVMTVAVSLKNEKLLKMVDQGAGDSGIEVTACKNEYLFSNDHDEIPIQKITVNPYVHDIEDIVSDGRKQGNPKTLTSKSVLSITGKEEFVGLGIYGEQLASIVVPGNNEHFLEQAIREQMCELPQEFYKSYSFLKFGTPEFTIQLYRAEYDLWLLTTGTLADNLPFSVLEKLTKHTEANHV